MSKIGVEHVTSHEKHENENFSIVRKVKLLIYWGHIGKPICTELMAFSVFQVH